MDKKILGSLTILSAFVLLLTMSPVRSDAGSFSFSAGHHGYGFSYGHGHHGYGHHGSWGHYYPRYRYRHHGHYGHGYGYGYGGYYPGGWAPVYGYGGWGHGGGCFY